MNMACKKHPRRGRPLGLLGRNILIHLDGPPLYARDLAERLNAPLPAVLAQLTRLKASNRIRVTYLTQRPGERSRPVAAYARTDQAHRYSLDPSIISRPLLHLSQPL
jgi:predicted ArsR family transcriptional regulator